MTDQPTTTLIDRLPNVRGTYRPHAQLSKTNWFNVGGPAEILYKPADTDDLSYFLAHKPHDIPLTILGVGSNLLVRDGGIDGVVIKLGRSFTHISKNTHIIEAGAGALSGNVARFSAEQGLSGLEFLSGIPGTIGGALAMNAGCYHAEVEQVLSSAELLDQDGTIHHMTPADIGYVYRGNHLPDGMIFTKAYFQGKPGESSQILERITQITQERAQTQPIKERTSGSTFKNPPKQKAWQLIDKAGCRGLKIGGAQVSEKHCNFFINTGNATAHDIETLGNTVIEKVKRTTGITLEWEIQIIGKHG